MRKPSPGEVEAAVRTLIAHAGDDPDRPELRDTPQRVAAAHAVAFSGYGRDPAAVLGEPLPAGDAEGQLVLLRALPFFSHCEHHFSPFFGEATVAFEAGERILGIGHLADLVTVLSRRLQLQERLTEEIAAALRQVLAPRGLAVLLEATHCCRHLHDGRSIPGRLRTLRVEGSLEARPGLLAALLGDRAPPAAPSLQSGSV